MYVTLDLPPGVYRTGTEYKSRKRWYSTDLMRWTSGSFEPIGGWVEHSTTTVTGMPRAVIAWKDNGGTPWAVVGTESNLYAMTRSGILTDITPTGFTAGRADAKTGAGYGAGVYGAGVYGASSGTSYSVIPASVWSVDTYGQYFVGVMADDATIYQWQLDVLTEAAKITNSPDASAIVVTAEGIIMALGAGSDPRVVQNCDIDDNTVWTPSVTNYARSQRLQTIGSLMTGMRINGGTLLFTDTDVWLATFIGQPFVYGYERRGQDCGIVSVRGGVSTQSAVFWMGKNSFWTYNGYAEPLACDVQDYVFSDFNQIQASKVSCVHLSAFGEVWWFYCSASSNEIDRYIIFNYREGHWAIGSSLSRLSGVDEGAFLCPMMCGADGYVYDHESGLSHGAQPTAETGPLEIGEGDNLVMVRQLVPDEKNLGDVQATYFTRIYPMGDETQHGPYTTTENTPVRMTGRQVSVLYVGADNTDFRIGSMRLEVQPLGAKR